MMNRLGFASCDSTIDEGIISAVCSAILCSDQVFGIAAERVGFDGTNNLFLKDGEFIIDDSVEIFFFVLLVVGEAHGPLDWEPGKIISI